MFQDGSFATISSASRFRSSIKAERNCTSVAIARFARDYNTSKLATFLWRVSCDRNRREPEKENIKRLVRSSSFSKSTLECKRFPFSSFRYSLTLFSKFFSSFPHGTCSLSVSRQYLALEGIYLPLWAAVPSNSTLRKRAVRYDHSATDGTITLYSALFQGTYAEVASGDCFYRLQFALEWERFSVWAFPASLAVTEGILVSFFSSA